MGDRTSILFNDIYDYNDDSVGGRMAFYDENCGDCSSSLFCDIQQEDRPKQWVHGRDGEPYCRVKR